MILDFIIRSLDKFIRYLPANYMATPQYADAYKELHDKNQGKSSVNCFQREVKVCVKTSHVSYRFSFMLYRIKVA